MDGWEGHEVLHTGSLRNLERAVLGAAAGLSFIHEVFTKQNKGMGYRSVLETNYTKNYQISNSTIRDRFT